jgi:hypothetical protein
VPPFCKAKFCGVPSGAVVKVGCAMGKERLWNTVLSDSCNLRPHIKVRDMLQNHIIQCEFCPHLENLV